MAIFLIIDINLRLLRWFEVIIDIVIVSESTREIFDKLSISKKDYLALGVERNRNRVFVVFGTSSNTDVDPYSKINPACLFKEINRVMKTRLEECTDKLQKITTDLKSLLKCNSQLM